MERVTSVRWTGQVELIGIKLKLAASDEMETLVVCTGQDTDGTPVVGFHSAIGPLEALGGAMRRVASGNMKWKADEYRANGSNP